MYPNPVSDKLAVIFNSDTPTELTITNILGEIVYSKHYQGGINEFISTLQFPAGNYVANLHSEKINSTKKISVQH